MNLIETKNKFLNSFGLEKLHPLHESVIDELIESYINDKIKDEAIDINYVLAINFMIANSTMGGLINGIFRSNEDCETITLKYREKTFILREKDSIVQSMYKKYS